MTSFSILVVDDHAIFRSGLVSLLNTRKGLKVVGDAADSDEALALALRLRPDVIIMDLMMPGKDGVETTSLIRSAWPDAKILILTTFSTSDGITRAMSAGATGAVLKNTSVEELVSAIQEVAAGRTYIANEIRQIMADDPPLPPLSPRQMRILEGIVRGLTSADIAKQLNISYDTVKGHTKALFLKLGVANRAEAAALALKKQLVKI